MTAKTYAWIPDPDDHVEWNTARDVWKPATVERITISRTGTVVRIVLDKTGRPLVVGLEHLRPSPAAPAAEQAKHVELDGMGRSVYVRMRDGDVDRSEFVNAAVNLDRDANGGLLGVEILGAVDVEIDGRSAIAVQNGGQS